MNTNAYDMIRQLRDMFQTQARIERYDATRALNACKMAKGTSVSDHLMKMKRLLDHLERLGNPVPLQLATDTQVNSLSDNYKEFVINYNMNNMEKTIAELHSMLKTAKLSMGTKTKDVLMVRDGGVKKKQGHRNTSKGKGQVQVSQSVPKAVDNRKGKGKGKGKGKKIKVNKARTENRCFRCHEVGHWRQNCPKRHETELSLHVQGNLELFQYLQDLGNMITMDSDDEIQYERDWDKTKRLEREKASLTTQLAKAVAQFKEKELHLKNHIKEQELQMKNQIKEKEFQMKNQIKEKELDFEKQIAETKLQCKKQIKESSKIIQFLDEKLHKIGVSERTIFLDKPSALRDFLDVKWGLGYENPNVLKKALKEKSAFFDFSSMLMSTRFPSLKGFEMKEEFSDMQEIEQHDPVYYEPKYHRVKFVYNSDTLRIKSKDSSNSSDFLVYPDIPSTQESDVEAKPYVPTLVLEEKIVDLENLLKTTQSEYESLKFKQQNEHNAEREMLLEQIQTLQQVVYESEHDLVNERNRFAKDRDEYVQEILELQRTVADLQKLLEDKAGQEKQNVELEFTNERHKFETEIEQLTKNVSDLQHTLTDERKVFDLKSEMLSKKISELEMKLVLERKQFERQLKNSLKKPSLRVGKYQNIMHEFEEEIQVVHSERKADDKKSIELQKQIVDLQNQLSDVRHQFKQKEKVLRYEKTVLEQIIAEPKKPTLVETDFEAQKEAFKAEMRKLTSKLSGLSADLMNEQRMRSDQQKKLNDLLEERNKLSSKVKELEKTVFKAHNSSYVDSASRSNINSSGQIRTSNLFYDCHVDRSGKHRYSTSKFIWQVKGSSTKVTHTKSFASEPKVQKNKFFHDTSFGKSQLVYSTNKLLSLSKRKSSGSYFQRNDFDIEVSMINPEPEDLPKKHNPRLDLVCEGVNEDTPNHHEGEKFHQRHIRRQNEGMGTMIKMKKRDRYGLTEVMGLGSRSMKAIVAYQEGMVTTRRTGTGERPNDGEEHEIPDLRGIIAAEVGEVLHDLLPGLLSR
ncbi:hypothetical protein OSB04_007172 [Centaurea solstitialis]|uniref:CCHC-type domain-containing protein n=1 Tax=Centaurea solstitialis TaxID=347529 RepID=A0AA38WI86_9ASTR|nr:hypothetical protein OSB04_007172 [Centaurea solstitialis]